MDPFQQTRTISSGDWKANNQALSSPALAWGVALAALTLTSLLLVVLIRWAGSRGMELAGLMIPVFCGAVGALLALVAIAARHALAYRFGIVFGPIGAVWILLGSLMMLGRLDPTATALVASIAILGFVTPILWTRPGVKRYFDLCCPECGRFRIAAESFTFFERRCLTCNTVFCADGTILRSGKAYAQAQPASWPTQPLAAPPPPEPSPTVPVATPLDGSPVDLPEMPTSAVPPVAAGATDSIPVLSYAGAYRGPFAGPAGVQRETLWFIVCAVIVMFLGMAQQFIEFSQPQQPLFGPWSSSAPLQMAAICLYLPGVLGLWVYWLVWIGMTHGEMRRFTGYDYKISPAKAVGFCFIPFFNLYWIIYMPYELARTLARYLGNKRGSDRSGSVLAFQILSLVPGSFLPGLSLLFNGLTMRAIQDVLNDLWRTARNDVPPGPAPSAVEVLGGTTVPSGLAPVVSPQPVPFTAAMAAPAPPLGEDAGMRMLLPVGRSGWAIAAGYLGLLSPLVVPAPFAVITAILAILDMRRNPEKHGMGRAIFGLVLGGIVTLIALVGAVSVIVADLR